MALRSDLPCVWNGVPEAGAQTGHGVGAAAGPKFLQNGFYGRTLSSISAESGPSIWGRPTNSAHLWLKTLPVRGSSGGNSDSQSKGAKPTRITVDAEDVLKLKQPNATQFMFHAEGGAQVRVLLQKHSSKYDVTIEVILPSYLPLASALYLHWGLYRSDSADWVLLEPDAAPPETIFVSGMDEAMETPLQQCSPYFQTLHLELQAEMVPFYISFVLHKPASEDHEALWIKRKCGTNFCFPVGIQIGHPDPLGVTVQVDGSANFSLYSKNAEDVILCLYNAEDTEPTMEIDLDPSIHRTGDIWHAQLESIEGFSRYGYRCKGEASWENGHRFHQRRVLLDPYARFLAPPVPGQEDLPSPASVLGWLKDSVPFAWEDDSHPCIPLETVVAYRLNVAGFTLAASSVSEAVRGTFVGLIEKIPHLKFLGVNAVILQPIFAYDRVQGPFHPLSYFSPMEVYSPSNNSLSASISLKEMVKSLHRNGIEVILDVVYSHTAENGDETPQTISFRGIDNATYYVLDQFKGILKSESGAANIFNCNHPAVHKMILDSLRYWVEEYHVDGFCFVNAPELTRGPHGQELSRPLLVEAISFDPVLSKSKLIADACSPITSVSKGLKFPHWKRWCEWNTGFRDDVRCFFRGDKGKLSNFATRLCGSGDMFARGRGPSFSMNFIANAYGLTLADVVSYSEAGVADPQYSWNCGEEGPSLAAVVRHTRLKQMRNLLVTLFLSQGIPVLNMGDEYGHSNGGTLGKETCRHFDWGKLDSDPELCQLISSLSSLRIRRKELLQKRDFVELEKLKWHGRQSDEEPLWEEPDSSFVAVSLQPPEGTVSDVGDLYLAFNAHDEVIKVTLPEPPGGMNWFQIADTSVPHSENFVLEGRELKSPRSEAIYDVQPFSVVILEARKSASAEEKAVSG